MSYNISIGEAEMVVGIEESEPEDSYFSVEVRPEEHESAPCGYNDVCGKMNQRWPGYSQWLEAMRMVGLEALFFDKEKGLMREHPGIQRLFPFHLESMESARRKLLREHPDAIPRFSDDKKYVVGVGFVHEPGMIVATSEDANLARLNWLIYWTDWALNNCKNPALHNS